MNSFALDTPGRCGWHGLNRLLAACALSLGLLLASASAQAMPVYDFVFDAVSGPDLSFQLPASPIPDNVASNRFEIFAVSALVGGSSDVLDIVRFFTDSFGGGFNVTEGGSLFFSTFGDQLFSGSVDAPTFLTGTFDLFDSTARTNSVGTLTISQISVPEPASLALFAVGLAGLRRWRNRRA